MAKKLNPKALEALRLLTEHPQYKTQISADNQQLVTSILSGVGADGNLYKYGEKSGLGDIGVGAWLNKKFNPFEADEGFAPGQQSAYGDVFARSGAGMRNAIRTLNDPETLEKSKRTIFGKEVNIGLPYAIPAFKEGFARPRSIETFQTENLDNFYNKPDVMEGYQRSGYLDSPFMQGMPQPIQSTMEHLDLLKNPKVALGGAGHSAGGLVSDIITNPADLALMGMPVPKWMSRLGDVPIGKGFVAGMKNVVRPAAVTTKAGVSAAEQAIRQGLKKPPKKQLEFDFVKNLKPKPKIKPAQTAPIIEKSGQQIFPFAKKKISTQGQMELKFPKKAPKVAKGQKVFDFMKPDETAALDDALKRVRPFSRQVKGPTAAEVPLHPAAEGRAAAAELPKIIAPKTKKVKPFAKKAKLKKKIVAPKASQAVKKGAEVIKHRGTDIEIKPAGKVWELNFAGKKLKMREKQAAIGRAKELIDDAAKLAKKKKGKGLRGQKGQAAWEDLTPEQRKALLKSLPKSQLDEIFKKKPAQTKATPKIFQKKPRAPRPSKNLGRVAREVDSGNWGRITKRTIEGGKEVFEITGGTFGDDVVKLSRDKINILTDKGAAKLGEPVFGKVEKVVPKAKPTAKTPVADPKAAMRTQHAALQKEILALMDKKPKAGSKEALKLAHKRHQFRTLGEQLKLTDAERVAAVKAGRKGTRPIERLEGYESFAKPMKKLREETGSWRPFGGGKEPSKKADTAADDMVKAFKKLLPEIIDDVKQNGGRVIDRIRAVTEDPKIIAMVEREIGKSAAAAKADITTKVGNWNVKNINENLRQGLQRMADLDPTIGKKGTKISDAQVKKMAADLTDSPTMRAILKGKPGQFAAEVRRTTDDAVSMLKSVLEDDFGPQGLMKRLQEVTTKAMKQQKDASSKMGRAFRQLQLTADDEAAIKGLINQVKMRYKRDPLLSPEDYAVIEKALIKLENGVLNTTNLAKFFDKGYYVWLNSLLSNPFTHGVNFMSNAMFLMEKVPNRAFDILGDYTLRGFARTKGIKLKPAYKWKEIPAMWRGFKRWTSKRASGKELPFKVKKGTKLDVDIPTPLSKSVNDIVGQPVSWLKKGDDIFKEATGYMEFYARHVMGERGDDLLASIYQEQLVRTFQDEAGPLARWLLEGKKRVPGLRWVIPFVKTPERLLMRGLERTPVGAAGKLVRDLVKGAPQKAISHDIGLVYESALLTMGVGWLWQNSKITGDAPDNEAERVAFYESGKKPNSIKIGNLWIPFSRMEPLGTALALMVNFTQDVAKSDKELPLDKIADGIGGITQTLANKTYFSGVLGFMRAASEPQIYGNRLISKFTSSWVPGIAKFAADLIDPTYRQSEGIVEEVAKRTPFASKTVEPTLGAFGDEQTKTFLGIGKEKTDRLTTALKDTPVPMPSRRLGGEKLTPKEYNDVLRKSGPYLKSILIAVTASPGWDALPRGIRSKIVEDAARQMRGVYRDQLRMKKIQAEIKADPKAYINKFLE